MSPLFTAGWDQKGKAIGSSLIKKHRVKRLVLWPYIMLHPYSSTNFQVIAALTEPMQHQHNSNVYWNISQVPYGLSSQLRLNQGQSCITGKLSAIRRCSTGNETVLWNARDRKAANSKRTWNRNVLAPKAKHSTANAEAIKTRYFIPQR